MKTFLSIGSGPGMGFATANRFAREGYHVVLAALDRARLDLLAKLVKGSAGSGVSVAQVDASSIDSISKLVADTESRWGSIDTLHYNAAALHPTTIGTLGPHGFASDLTVNIGGAYAAIHAVLPMMAHRSEGTILLTGGKARRLLSGSDLGYSRSE